jgi:short-subunit dehydrogenase
MLILVLKKERTVKVEKKVFLVTGGASGIGRALALELLSRGASVAAVDINTDGLDDTWDMACSYQPRLSKHIVDITDRAAVETLPNKIILNHGAIDGVINNAGIIQPFDRVNDLEYDAIARVMDVNFNGTVNVTKTFLPYLLERPEGHIVSISSMGAYVPVPGQTVYGAAKAAVTLFTEGLNSELMDTNVKVTVVFQGATDTNIAQNSGITLLPVSGADGNGQSFATMTPDEAAEQIVDGIEKDRYQLYVGKDAAFMNFLYRLSPQRAAKTIFNQMRSLLEP